MRRPIEHNFFVCKTLPVLKRLAKFTRYLPLQWLFLPIAVKLLRIDKPEDAAEPRTNWARVALVELTPMVGPCAGGQLVRGRLLFSYCFYFPIKFVQTEALRADRRASKEIRWDPAPRVPSSGCRMSVDQDIRKSHFGYTQSSLIFWHPDNLSLYKCLYTSQPR